jgi:tellurite resistance-related uncharacterized protein
MLLMVIRGSIRQNTLSDDMIGETTRVISDGIWTWYNDPRAVVRNNALYLGYIRNNGDVAVTKIVLSTGVRTMFTLAASFEIDDHDNPSLVFTPAGRLVAFYSKHGSGSSQVRMRVATNIESITAFGAETTVPTIAGGLGSTYTNPWVLSSEGDRLYLFSRDSARFPTITYSDDWDSGGTPTWATTYEYFGETGNRPYIKLASDGVGKIHFLASRDHPTEITASECHMYHWYYDASDGNFHQTDGTIIRSLASLSTTGKLQPSEVTKIYDADTDSSGNGNAWPWDLQLDDTGKPVGVFSAFESIDNNRYVYTRWTGSAWVRHDLLSGQGSLYGAGDTAEDQYAGGLCLNPDNTNIVYLANDTSGQYEIEKRTTDDGGATWNTVVITSGSSVKNARPMSPRGLGGPEIIWWRGTPGAANAGYTSFTVYSTEICVYPPIVSPTYRGLALLMGPIAYYPLDESSGTVAEDIANNYNGTHVNSPTLGLPAMISEGFSAGYDGISKRTDLPDLSVGEGSFTYVCFFKTTQNAADKMWIAESSTTDTDPFTTLGMTSGKVRGWLRNNAGTGLISMDTPLTYNDGLRHHASFACLTGGAGTSGLLCVDGIQRDVDSTSSTSARTLNKSTIGALVRATIGNWGEATLDELLIFNRQLSVSESNALYEARDIEPVSRLTRIKLGVDFEVKLHRVKQGGSFSLKPLLVNIDGEFVMP